ncbi:MAG TPA: MarR family transcriptional regulator [Patescibacteria group bacterium]|nr:MarR family transcriptional regulator [Patescibacteria group bacterium]
MQKIFHRFFKLIDFKREYQQKSSGLNFLQLHTLENIYKEKAMKTLEISKVLQISPSTLIGVLDELERQKLILRERQEKDKRVVMVTVTNNGEEVVKKHFEEDEKFLTNLLKELNEDEQKHLTILLDKITGNISEPDELFK